MTQEERARAEEHLDKLMAYMETNKIEDPMDAFLAMHGFRWRNKSGAFVSGSNSQESKPDSSTRKQPEPPKNQSEQEKSENQTR